MRDDQITIITEDGTEEIVDVVFTHEHEGKLYIVFEVPNSEELTAAIYVPESDEDGLLQEIETEEEWEMIERELEKYFEDLEDSEEDEELE